MTQRTFHGPLSEHVTEWEFWNQFRQGKASLFGLTLDKSHNAESWAREAKARMSVLIEEFSLGEVTALFYMPEDHDYL